MRSSRVCPASFRFGDTGNELRNVCLGLFLALVLLTLFCNRGFFRSTYHRCLACFQITAGAYTATSASELPHYDPDRVYNNFSVPKGLALIINNSLFKSNSYREGSRVDVMSICHLLEKLGYKVKTKENLPAQQMLEEAQRFANDDSHSGCHSCIVVVMTHGKYDEICGTDEKAIKVDDFVECFNAPGLDGKPKLFFIQACREMESDRGSVQRSAPRRDVLVAYPTAPKCLAYRHKTKGSPFIQSVCEVFIKYAHSESVESMLKRVSKRVYESSDCRQTPEYTCGLSKDFYFFVLPGRFKGVGTGKVSLDFSRV